MKTIADPRGVALIFENPIELDGTIESLIKLRESKRHTGKSYPAVYCYVDQRMNDEEAKEFHDEIWWMGYAIKPKQRPAADVDTSTEDN